MDKKDQVRKQFDLQAKKFSRWAGTTDERALRHLFNFIGFAKNYDLLDVACGSGDFAIFSAKRIHRVCGVDISANMIELAKKHARSLGLDNISFECHDVEELPFESGCFAVVTSKSAFHHMKYSPKVFEEMVRCCKEEGLICLDDLAGYDIPHVRTFFDELDETIDPSHNARVPKNEFRNLFGINGVEILRVADLEFEISVELYASHAVQSKEALSRVDELIAHGLKDPEISKFLYLKDNKPVFRNVGYRVLGKKL